MNDFSIRAATPADYDTIAEMIHVGTNYWYETHGMGRIFGGAVAAARIFPEVYEDLDPDCCLLAVDDSTGRLAGSCFYHVRPTHVSLGILNAHPAYLGRGAARILLAAVIAIAERQNKPVRLVSSALNLDSFSLYNRAGFVPRQLFQDMIISVPEGGLVHSAPEGIADVRVATLADIPHISALEETIQGISRPGDWTYFIENKNGIWHTVVHESADGTIDGALSSVSHPGSNLIGPGIAAHTDVMALLLWQQLNFRRGTTPVFLLPVTESKLVQTAYGWGAKNCELHVSQCRGEWFVPTGVVMPSFMPESA
ncbi:MAG: GNAT family N-acetyltransferase [Fibrella sp.]|nr:GNAT family N-acetyltransferase [Armatimonadota bacterium]